jgi:GR25 family glycosyltransferase involved in LPS biosynthesis
MDCVDCIYYINLAHRKDRNDHMQTWLRETGVPESKIQRIDAVHRPDKGYIGCTESHIKALETFIQSDHNVCCIYEDDYKPTDAPSYWSNL